MSKEKIEVNKISSVGKVKAEENKKRAINNILFYRKNKKLMEVVDMSERLEKQMGK